MRGIVKYYWWSLILLILRVSLVMTISIVFWLQTREGVAYEY